MQGTRKTKNRYQMNIAIYKTRIQKAKCNIVKKRLRGKIAQFKLQIKRIETREAIIKKISSWMYEMYDLDITIRELLIIKLVDGHNSIKPQNEQVAYLIKVRSMFFKMCHMYGIDGFDLYTYYRLECAKSAFYVKKYKSLQRAKNEYKEDWNQFRNYLKQHHHA